MEISLVGNDLIFQFNGQPRVVKKLHDLASIVKDWTPAFEDAGDRLLEYYGVEVFNAQGVAGEQWRNLSPATIRARTKHWGYYKTPGILGPDAILLWTGRLRAGFRKEVQPRQLRIYNVVEYFKYHQLGSGRRPPKRRMLALTKDTIDQVRQAMTAQIRKVFYSSV